jgi:hypothetical protein
MTRKQQTRMELAKHHDKKMRSLEAGNIANWSTMAEVAIIVNDNEYWRDLGFGSWDAWMHDAAPHSAKAMYRNTNLLRDLKQDVPMEDLRRIPRKSAKVMQALPKSVRRKRDTIDKATRMKPEHFVREIQTSHPDLHIENLVKREHAYSKSQSEIIDGAIALYRLVEEKPEASEEEAHEAFAVDYVMAHHDEYTAMCDKNAIPDKRKRTR